MSVLVLQISQGVFSVEEMKYSRAERLMVDQAQNLLFMEKKYNQKESRNKLILPVRPLDSTDKAVKPQKYYYHN